MSMMKKLASRKSYTNQDSNSWSELTFISILGDLELYG